MNVSKVFNANVYIDGTNSLLGRAKEVTLLDVVANTEEHKGLGMVGALELPNGLAAMVTKIKWAGWYPDQLTLGANPFKSHKLQLRASVEEYGAGGRVGEKALVVLLTVSWKKTPLGAFVSGAGQEPEDELTTTYVKVTLDGKELVEIDVHENVWRVNGVDVLETYRKNLGG